MADPQPGEVWWSRRKRDQGRAVLVAAVNVGTVSTCTLTSPEGGYPFRRTTSAVRLGVWHDEYKPDQPDGMPEAARLAGREAGRLKLELGLL